MLCGSLTGGHLSHTGFEGRWWHSLDGGDTWTKEAVPGLNIISMDMLDDGKTGFCVAMTAEGGVELIRYKGPVAAIKNNRTSALHID